MADNVLLLVAIVAFLIAVSGAGRGWNPTIEVPSGQYSLRSLVLLLTLAPPAIALIWTQGDFMLKSLERIIPPSRPRPPRPQTPPWVHNSPSAPTNQYAADMAVFHQLAGWSAALFFSIAAVLIGTAFYRSHDWTRPPRKSPLIWSALVMSLLAAATLTAFVLSDPTVLFPPNSEDPFKGQ